MAAVTPEARAVEPAVEIADESPGPVAPVELGSEPVQAAPAPVVEGQAAPPESTPVAPAAMFDAARLANAPVAGAHARSRPLQPATDGSFGSALAPAARDEATLVSESAGTPAILSAGPATSSRLSAIGGRTEPALAAVSGSEGTTLVTTEGDAQEAGSVSLAAAPVIASSGMTEPAVPRSSPESTSIAAAGAPREGKPVTQMRPVADAAPATEAPTASVVSAEAPHPQSVRPAPASRAKGTVSAGTHVTAFAVPAVARPAFDAAQAKEAALAWSGDTDTRLDPQSLAAIQSFMAPKPAGGASSVRDGLDATLSGLPCSRLTAAFSPGSGEIEVRGHARDRATASEAVERVRTAVGSSIPVVGDILLLPEPQCGVLDRVEALGLPQSTDQTDDPLVVGRAAQARYLPLEEGEPMVFALEAADYDAYIHVDYFDAAGNVTHLTPNRYAPLTLQPAGRRYAIGGGGANGSGIRLSIAPPFGKEIVTVIAATHPLHRGERPLTEDGAAYLAAMRNRLAELRVSVPGFRGEWAYMFLETFPRGGRPGG